MEAIPMVVFRVEIEILGLLIREKLFPDRQCDRLLNERIDFREFEHQLTNATPGFFGQPL
jgi:hypothetical protein